LSVLPVFWDRVFETGGGFDQWLLGENEFLVFEISGKM
jgi:hypothetical protein